MPLRVKHVHLTTRSQWRCWLAANHDRETNGIWLVFHKKATGTPSLYYEDSVEEALCFGWIDSVVKRIDDDLYCRKFTPRRDGSQWSPTNRRRAAKCIREGQMTEFGLAKIAAAKRSGTYDQDQRPVIDPSPPADLAEALARNPKAKESFEKLAPSHQKQYVGWIVTAKRPETRAKRLKESLRLLANGKQLGLK